MRLPSTRCRCMRGVLLATLWVAGGALMAADVRLDLLGSCELVTQTLSSLKSGGPGCRPARSSMERAIDRRLKGRQAKTCFVETGGTALSRFSCMRFDFESAKELFCFSGRDNEDIDRFVESYDSGGDKRVKRYLDAAAACTATNGDAAHAKKFNAPGQLHMIAKFATGFIVGVGGNPATGSVQHGFATLDPALGFADSGVEYFSALYGSETAGQFALRKRGRMQTIGGLRFYEDDDVGEVVGKLARDLRRNGIDAKVATRGVSVEQGSARSRTGDEKSKLISSWVRKLSSSLEDEGFQTLDDDDLKRLSGFQYAEFRRRFESGMPYGLRDDDGTALSQDLTILTAPRDRCSKSQGVMMALIMGVSPTGGIQRDYGALTFVLLGLGECGRSGATSRYIDALAGQTYSEMIRALEATP
jgi:hypothetical protein